MNHYTDLAADRKADQDQRYRDAAKARFVNGSDGRIEIADHAFVEIDTVLEADGSERERGAWIEAHVWVPLGEAESAS